MVLRFLAALASTSYMFLHVKVACLVDRVDIYHLITGQPLDEEDDDDRSHTDRCSEPSSSTSSDGSADDESL